MFKEMGAMMSLLGKRGKIQEEIEKFQANIGTITAEATTGAGYVTVKVNGKMEVLSIRISEEAMQIGDRAMEISDQRAGRLGPRRIGNGVNGHTIDPGHRAPDLAVAIPARTPVERPHEQRGDATLRGEVRGHRFEIEVDLRVEGLMQALQDRDRLAGDANLERRVDEPSGELRELRGLPSPCCCDGRRNDHGCGGASGAAPGLISSSSTSNTSMPCGRPGDPL